MDAAANVAIVKHLYAAFARRDMAAIVAVLSPDVVWSEPANPFNPAGGTRRGHAGFFEWARAGNEAEDVLSIEPRAFLTNARTVAVVGHTRCRVRATGRSYETDFVHLVTLDECGLVTSFQEFFDTWAAAEAFRPT